MILDRAGRVFVAPGIGASRAAGDNPLTRRLRTLAAEGGEGTTGGALSGVENPLGMGDRLIGFATDRETTGWTLLIDRSTGSAFADARRTLVVELSILALLVALGIGGALILGRRLRAEQRAARAAEERMERLQAMTAGLSAASTPARRRRGRAEARPGRHGCGRRVDRPPRRRGHDPPHAGDGRLLGARRARLPRLPHGRRAAHARVHPRRSALAARCRGGGRALPAPLGVPRHDVPRGRGLDAVGRRGTGDRRPHPELPGPQGLRARGARLPHLGGRPLGAGARPGPALRGRAARDGAPAAAGRGERAAGHAGRAARDPGRARAAVGAAPRRLVQREHPERRRHRGRRGRAHRSAARGAGGGLHAPLPGAARRRDRGGRRPAHRPARVHPGHHARDDRGERAAGGATRRDHRARAHLDPHRAPERPRPDARRPRARGRRVGPPLLGR